MEYTDELFAANLRAERARADMTQEQLATKIGISSASVVGYEKGTTIPTLRTLYKLAVALGTTPHALMGWE